MSFAGVGSFGNYDQTAQNTGMPTPTSVPAGGEKPDKQSEGASAAATEAAGTRATSVTEMGTETPARDNKTTPGPDTASEIEGADEQDAEQCRNEEVQALARRYTNQSHATGVEPRKNVFLAAASDKESLLNPNSSHSQARA